MVNEAEFAAQQAAKKAKKAASSEKKLQRDAEHKKRKKGDEGEGEGESQAADAHARDDDSRAEPALAASSSAPTAAPAAQPAATELLDKTVTCVDCGNDFVFSAGEQEFFLTNGYAAGKSRCKECTRAKKARFGEATDAAGRRAATTTCYACGKVGHSSKDCKVNPRWPPGRPSSLILPRPPYPSSARQPAVPTPVYSLPNRSTRCRASTAAAPGTSRGTARSRATTRPAAASASSSSRARARAATAAASRTSWSRGPAGTDRW